jgi:glycine dehydrogenase subunit 2
MISIAKESQMDPQFVKGAPYSTRTSRVDEVTAARKPVLRWKGALRTGPDMSGPYPEPQ